jgi:hypothetical protein
LEINRFYDYLFLFIFRLIMKEACCIYCEKIGLPPIFSVYDI